MKQGLYTWLYSKEFGPDETIEEKYNTLIYRQGKIGWYQVFTGQLAEDWSTLQDAYLEENKTLKNKHRSGGSWVTGLIALILNQLNETWKARNNQRHGCTPESREQKQLEQTQRDLETLYSRREEMLPCDQEHLYRSVEEHLKMEPTSLARQQWLNIWEPVVLQGINKGQRLGLQVSDGSI